MFYYQRVIQLTVSIPSEVTGCAHVNSPIPHNQIDQPQH